MKNAAFMITLFVGLCVTITNSYATQMPSENEEKPASAMIGLDDRLSVDSRFSDLICVPEKESKIPFHVRIVSREPHDGGYRYQLAYLPLEAGTFNIGQALRRPVDENAEHDVSKSVSVGSIRDHQTLDLSAVQLSMRLHIPWYRWSIFSFGVIWLCGLIYLVTSRPRKQRIPETPVLELTLEQKIAKLLMEASNGMHPDLRNSEIERLLLTHWQSELKLRDLKTEHVIARLERDPRISPTLAMLNQSLHAPRPLGDIKIHGYLNSVHLQNLDPADAYPSCGERHAE